MKKHIYTGIILVIFLLGCGVKGPPQPPIPNRNESAPSKAKNTQKKKQDNEQKENNQ